MAQQLQRTVNVTIADNNLLFSGLFTHSLSSGWATSRSDIMFLWHQPHLDPHPPGVQGSQTGLEPDLCLWDTQGQSQRAHRLKDHCLFCLHHCGFCHCPHTHNLTASKQTHCSLCSQWNCLPAYSNSTASNDVCSKGNFLYRCYPEHTYVYVHLGCNVWHKPYNMYIPNQTNVYISWLQYRHVCLDAHCHVLLHTYFTDYVCHALLQMYSLYKDPSGEVTLDFSNIAASLIGTLSRSNKVGKVLKPKLHVVEKS